MAEARRPAAHRRGKQPRHGLRSLQWLPRRQRVTSLVRHPVTKLREAIRQGLALQRRARGQATFLVGGGGITIIFTRSRT